MAKMTNRAILSMLLCKLSHVRPAVKTHSVFMETAIVRRLPKLLIVPKLLRCTLLVPTSGLGRWFLFVVELLFFFFFSRN
jgi:hypothetical protein